MDDEDLTSNGAAAVAKVHPDTLARWRREDYGPPYYRIGPGGKIIRYRKQDILDWKARQRIAPGARPGGTRL